MKTIKFKVDDRVFSYTLQEWGTVEMRVATSSNTTITVYFDSLKRKRIYEEDGRLFPVDKAPDLFYDEVEITPTPRPLPDLKVNTEVIVWDDDIPEERFRRHFAGWKNRRMLCFSSGFTSWTISRKNLCTAWENWEIIKDKN